MDIELNFIFNNLKHILSTFEKELTVRNSTEKRYELWSEKDIYVEGKKRKEVFFAGLIIQKSYVGFYFMPVYTDKEISTVFSSELQKLQKGKSCFYIRKLDEKLEQQITDALKIGFRLYKERGWI